MNPQLSLEPSSQPNRCPRCGAGLPPGVLSGHCPRCLVATSLGDGADEDPAGQESTVEGLPRRLGDYELLEEVGRGGMGVVYRAHQISLNREVALKVLPGGEFARPEFRRRFRGEALIVAQLRHPNIVAIYDVGEQEGVAYFTMEWVPNRTLGDLVQRGPVSALKAARYLSTLAKAVHFAHDRGVLHRDLKPTNILLDSFDEPRLSDFGLARSLAGGSDLTLTGQALGSPAYMSPEQARAGNQTLGRPGDVYSLGAILYHLLTGRPPFQGESLHDVLTQVRQAEPISPRKLLPSIPEDLQTVCLKCLEKNPADRYQTARELAEELDRFLEHRPIQARPASLAKRGWRWGQRNPALAALAVVLLLGLAGIFGQWQRAEHFARTEHAHRQRAEQSELTTRLNLYAADLSAASLAVERGDFGLAAHLLDAHVPSAGQVDLRGFEWRYLDRICRGQQQATLNGHDWIVTCAAFSPDGRLLATGSQDHTVRVWDVEGRSVLTNLSAHTATVWSVAFTPDGRQLLTSGFDQQVKFWDTTTWQMTAQFAGRLAGLSRGGSILATSEGNPFRWDWEPAGKVTLWNYRTAEKLREIAQPGRRVELSPDGTLLAVVNADWGVSLYRVHSGERIATLPTEEMLWALAFSSSGEHLAATSYLREHVYVWDLARPSPPVRLSGHTRTVWSVAFSPDGKGLATTSSDRSVRIWDTATWTQRGILRGHQNEVWCAAFSPDGRVLATGGKDTTVMLWSTTAPREQPHFAHRHFARPFFSPDGRSVVTLDRLDDMSLSKVWDVELRTPLAVLTNQVALGYAPDGQHLLVAAADQPALEYWSVKDRQLEKRVDLRMDARDWPLHYAGFSPTSEFGFGISEAGLVTVFESKSGKRLGSAPGPKPKIRAGAINAAATHVAVSTERDSLVWLWEVATGREQRLKGHHSAIVGLDFSPDGDRLVTASVDGNIRLWNVATGEAIAALTGHAEEASDVAFSPDGRTLASIGARNSVKFWHVATRRELMTLDRPDATFHLVFSPDGRHLAFTLGPDHTERLELLEAPLLETAPRHSP